MKQSPTSSLRGVVFCTCISDATSPEFVCDLEKLWTGESGHLCWMDVFTLIQQHLAVTGAKALRLPLGTDKYTWSKRS